MYPPQPPHDPHSGGQSPYPGGQNPYPGDQNPYPGGQSPYPGGQNPYQQGPPGYQGAPEAKSDKMPGTAITVRVLMFIGGVSGLLLGGVVLLIGLMAGGDNEFSQGFAEGVQETGVNVGSAEIIAVLAITGGVMFVYGLLSTALASFMGRRSGGILWSIVVFQALAALLLLVNIFTGAVGSAVPLLFAIGMIVLMVVPASRSYYTSVPTSPHTGY
jgi:hypothetical protein